MSDYSLQCRHCKGDNSITARYCVFCGNSLDGPPPWSMCGYNAQRSLTYPKISDKLFSDQHYKYDANIEPTDLSNLPQPVFAFDTFWCWNLTEKSLIGLELNQKNGSDRAIIKPNINSDESPSYANSLCFDGVLINGIMAGEFFRVSMYDGEVVSRIKESDITTTQKTAPLISTVKNPNNPYRPFKFFIAPMENHVFVVDISEKGAEKHLLIRWEKSDNEFLRSPVQKGDYVYCFSSRGRVLKLNVGGRLGELERAANESDAWNTLASQTYLSPVVVGNSIVCEVLDEAKTNNSGKNDRWYQRSILTIEDVQTTSQSIQGAVNDRSLKAKGHLSPLTDGKRVYFPGSQKNTIFQCLPGKKPRLKTLKNVNHNNNLPEISVRTSLFVKEFLYIFDEEHGQIDQYNINSGEWVCSFSLSTGRDLRTMQLRLHAQPIMFANVIGLVLSDQIYWCDISRTF